MLVDAFDPVSPPRVFVVCGENQTLAAIVDGSGSWGSGREAADWARARLGELWRQRSSWSVHELAEDISVVASSTPAALRDPEFGWSFSITCLVCANGVVTCLASGLYRVDALGRSGVTTLFRPEMLVDQLMANGTLTPEAALTFPHQNVCIGPFVGDQETGRLTTKQHTLLRDELLLVTHQSRFDLATLRPPKSAAALAALAREGAHPSPVIVITP